MLFFESAPDFGCNQCGDCCRQHQIPLNHFDVTRLLHAGVSQEVVGLLPTVSEDPCGLLLYGQKQLLILSKDKYSKDCLLMQDNQCTQYNHRPTVCRTWPMVLNNHHKLEIGKEHFLLYEVACDKVPFKEKKQMKKDIAQNIREYSEFRFFCRRWNAQVKHFQDQQTLNALFSYINREFD